MNPERPVFFYSEKDNFCQQLKNLLAQHPEIAGSVSFFSVTRSSIPPPQIKSVPTIAHGGKLFTGVNALQWINQQIAYSQEMLKQMQHNEQSHQTQQRVQQGQQGQQGQQAQYNGQIQQGQQGQRPQQNNGQSGQGQQMPQQTQGGPQIEQPMVDANGNVLEAYCDASGNCYGTELSLFNNPKFQGMTEEVFRTKAGDFMSIAESEMIQSPQGQQGQQVRRQ